MIRRPRQPVPAGFTLIELMLSIALVLILLVGVNKVFQTTGDAVGAGQTVNGFTRDQRSSQALLFDDFRNVVRDTPVFMINSRRTSQYLNQADFQSSVGGNPLLIDLNNDGKAGDPSVVGEIIPPTATNFRSHRVDTLCFTARGNYRRRTANAYSFSSSTTADDAFVWIGHAALPGKNTVSINGVTYTPPGNPYYYGPEHVFAAGDANATPTGRVGAFAADWVLARQVILMKDFYALSGENAYLHGSAAFPCDLSPLGAFSADNGTPSTFIQQSVYDLAGSTIEQFRGYVTDAVKKQRASTPTVGQPFVAWWNALAYASLSKVLAPLPTAADVVTPSALTDWDSPGGAPDQYRFAVNTLQSSQPTSTSIAQMAPFFGEHVSQFVVEYAGDYMTQNPAGLMTKMAPDGQVDFFIDANGNRQIRWYGMPRNVRSPNGAVKGFKTGDTVGTNWNAYADVIPLRDFYQLAISSGISVPSQYAPFEVDLDFDPTDNYAAPAATAHPFNELSRYVTAWTNDTPAMVRILVKVDDPTNRVPDGPWFQYVFQLK